MKMSQNLTPRKIPKDNKSQPIKCTKTDYHKHCPEINQQEKLDSG